MKDDRSCYTIKLKEKGEIGIGMCVWSTGLMMNPLLENTLAGKLKRFTKAGAIVTDDRLQALREDGSVVPDVYGIGDCAAMENASYPATAQVASQKAGWLAKRLNKGDIEQQKFTYKNLGVMAYVRILIGKNPSPHLKHVLTLLSNCIRLEIGMPYFKAKAEISQDAWRG